MAGLVVGICSGLGGAKGMLGGMFADRIGRIKIITYALGFISFGSILGAVSNSFTLLLLSRIIEGAGYIGTMAILPALIANLSADRHRAFSVSLFGSVTPLGMAITMMGAPAIIHQYGWRNLWWLTGLFTVLFMIFTVISYRGIASKILKNNNSYWINKSNNTSNMRDQF